MKTFKLLFFFIIISCNNYKIAKQEIENNNIPVIVKNLCNQKTSDNIHDYPNNAPPIKKDAFIIDQQYIIKKYPYHVIRISKSFSDNHQLVLGEMKYIKFRERLAEALSRIPTSFFGNELSSLEIPYSISEMIFKYFIDDHDPLLYIIPTKGQINWDHYSIHSASFEFDDNLMTLPYNLHFVKNTKSRLFIGTIPAEYIPECFQYCDALQIPERLEYGDAFPIVFLLNYISFGSDNPDNKDLLCMPDASLLKNCSINEMYAEDQKLCTFNDSLGSKKALRSPYKNLLIQLVYPDEHYIIILKMLYNNKIFTDKVNSEHIKIVSRNNYSCCPKVYEAFNTFKPIAKKSCYICNELTNKKCGKCLKVYYCSEKCQRLHFKYHKKICKKD